MTFYLLAFLAALWAVIQESSFYILFGFFAAGLIHAFVPTESIVKFLGKKSWKSVVNASLIGIPLPLCSCSVLPTAATLRKKGASRGATSSFLVSTPETGVDSIALTYGLMDLPMTILRPAAAFLTAMAAGLMVNEFGGKEEAPAQPAKTSRCCGSKNEASKDAPAQKPFWLWKTLRFAYVDLVNDLAHWLALGFVLSAMIAAWMPATALDGWAGQGVTSLLIMLAISMPMYICASASTPIAASLIAKGLSPGAAIVFLLAGPATNIGAIPLLIKMLGKRSTILYLLSIFTVSFLIGLGVNMAANYFHYSPIMALASEHRHSEGWLPFFTGLIFTALLLKGLAKKYIPKLRMLFIGKADAVKSNGAKCCGK